MLDVDQLVRIASEKTDHAILRVNSDAIAIRVLLGRRDDRPHRNIFQFADSLESVTNLSPLNRKLMFVTHVLVSASSTPAKIGTLWLQAIRRVLLHFDEVRLTELFFLAHDLGRDSFAFDHIRNENGLALFPSDAFAAESDVFDFQINNAHVINTL